MTDGTILYQFDPTTMSIDEFIRGDEAGEEQSEEADRIELHQDDGSTAIIFKNEDGKWYDIHGNEFWENEASIWFNLTDNSEWYY